MASTRVARAARTAIVLFALGGGAAGWLWLREVRPREALHQAREDAKRLFHFGRLDVRAGTLRTRGATIAFARDDHGRFVLHEPVTWPGDQAAIAALLDRMVAIKVDPVLTEAATPAERASWGLEPPAIRLDVTLDGGEEKSLLVGEKNELVGKFPVTDGERARVGLSDAAFYWAFDRDPPAFRDKHLLSLDPTQVARLSIERPGAPALEVERTELGAPWQIRLPSGETRRANPRRTDLLVIAFTRRLEASGFLTDAYEPGRARAQRRWGLAEPEGRVELATFTGTTRTLTFGRLRPTSAEEGVMVAHPSGTRTVAEVEPWVETELDTVADALVDRTLSRFDPEDVAQLRLRLGTEGPYRLARTEDGWSATEARPLASWKVDALVRAFGLLEGEGTHAVDPTPAQRTEWLLDPPSRRLTFLGEDGRILADVRIGNRLDDTHLLAQAEGDPRVLTVAEHRLRTLPASLEDLSP